VKRGECDGIPVHIPKETIWKEMAAKTEQVKSAFLLVWELSGRPPYSCNMPWATFSEVCVRSMAVHLWPYIK
jgi:hypothetical protein